MVSRISSVLGAAFAVTTATASVAMADQRIEAGTPQRFTTPEVTMAQGERLTFRNSDIARHDVVAEQVGPDQKPLFSTPLLGQNEEAFVDGSQYLVTGTYAFVCSIHASMKGTLTVTSAGAPVPRPGVGGTPPDTTAPKVRLAVRTGTLRKTRADRALTVVVTLDEAATVTVKATARGRTIGSKRVSLGPGDTKVRVPVGAAHRKRLRTGTKVTVRATAADAAGNRSSTSARRSLR